MYKKHSLQGIPRPDKIILHRGKNASPETISSTGYYHDCCDKPPVKMTQPDVCTAFAIVNQMNGFSLPSRSTYYPPCCDYRYSYFEYGGVRVPVNQAPQLEAIFKKYRFN